jgi:hypothetical protein
MELKYQELERQLTEALPELCPAAERYWSEADGDYLPYVFVGGVLAPYVEVLLVMPSSSGRDRLLEEFLAGGIKPAVSTTTSSPPQPSPSPSPQP